MISFFKNMFGKSTEIDYKTLVKNGAMIVDVRSRGEYQGGHVKGSTNVPLNNLVEHVSKWDKSKPIITCCASGMRSASAKNILESNSFKEVYNGGGWTGLERKLA